LKKLAQQEPSLSRAAAKAGMSEKTARKYMRSGRLPSESAPPRTWRTRPDPFEGVWAEMVERLATNPGLEAKTIFEHLQRTRPGEFSDGQLRTLQRRVKHWRAVDGPAQEVFFAQVHEPGALGASDFTHMSSLGVTIGGEAFEHLLYHFVLTYSNWETVTIVVSESFESLSEGLQHALWELGGVPVAHRTDRMSTAVNKMDHPDTFTQRYRGLLDHYGLEGQRIQTGKANENGDVEQRHHRLKRALDQALMLRGSRDFPTRDAYELLLREVLTQLNAGRRDRFAEELKVLRALPAGRLPSVRRVAVRVRPSSTIRVLNNVYSVHSRLIGETVEARVSAERVEVWYAGRCVDGFPRLRGERKHRIDYRHVIASLVKKPGAFERYGYRADLFPTSRFRMAYDRLREERPGEASRTYVKILHLAATESEAAVDAALGTRLARGEAIDLADLKETVTAREVDLVTDVRIAAVDLRSYDALLSEEAPCLVN
jgi:transposase